MEEQPQFSVHILLPDKIERKLANWARQTPGASWPDWGGHITLIPNFTPFGPEEYVVERLSGVCQNVAPFTVHLDTPMAVQDTTRPHYQVVFLAAQDEEQGGYKPLVLLRSALLDVLEGMRNDLNPAVSAQTFIPHVTLALSIGEAEARSMVRTLRKDGLQAVFLVNEVWLLVRRTDDTGDVRYDRIHIPLLAESNVGAASNNRQ